MPLDGDPGGPVLAPDGQFLYLLDRGQPNNNPDKNVNGRLHAVSMTTRSVAAVTEVGSKPRGLVLDERGRQLLLVSDGPPVKGPGNRDRPGELRVIRGRPRRRRFRSAPDPNVSRSLPMAARCGSSAPTARRRWRSLA